MTEHPFSTTDKILNPPMIAPRKSSLRDNVKTILIAVMLAITFRSLAYEPFHIPSGSMKSTLLVGDYIFVSKFSYGYSRFSFPFGIKFFSGRIGGNTPQRGDIVVFRYPGNTSIDYIKRLIGLPGDHIQMRGGVLYINGRAVPKIPVDDYVDDEDKLHPVTLKRFTETLPEGKSFNVLDMTTIPEDDTMVYVVPPKHYFMMGDNRDNSRDSRFMSEVGFVPEENLIGRAEMILASSDKSAEWFEVWKWPATLRTERFFKSLR